MAEDYHTVTQHTIDTLRELTAHVTLLTLGDGVTSERDIRRQVFREGTANDDPARAYLLALGMFAGFLHGVSRHYQIPLEHLTGMFGAMTRDFELLPTPMELHPSHPRFHQRD